MKRFLAGLALFFGAVLFFQSVCTAAPRTEELDLDKDGFKETKIYYERNVKVKTETDKNKDGKVDQTILLDKGKRIKAEVDKNFDGKTDIWYEYDSKGMGARTLKDSNYDGKPDSSIIYIDGRNSLIKEKDKNFDGKIDERSLDEWDGNKMMSSVINGKIQRTPAPGYIHLWMEKDTNYDGVVDYYKERKSKVGTRANHSTTLGKAMNQDFSQKPTEKKEEKSHAGGGVPTVEQKIKGLNERFGLKE